MPFRSPFPALEIPDVTLTDYVLAREPGDPDRPALVEAASGRTLTYRSLSDGVRKVAAGLADRGFSAGDVLMILLPNLPEYPVVFHAVATLGGISTPANPLLTAEELGFQLRDARARLVVTIPDLVDRVREAATEAPVEEIFVLGESPGATPFSELTTGGSAIPAVDVDPAEDVVVLPYSSGTTGFPKGVQLTHRNLVANIAQVELVHRLDEAAVVLGVLPFFHIYGLVVVLNHVLRSRATVVTMPRFELGGALQAIEAHRVTHAYLVPPIVLALARQPAVDEHDLSSLELVMSGAAPLGAELECECATRLDCKVRQGYGMTEASPVTHLAPLDPERARPGSVGPPVSSTEMRIVDPATGSDLGPGEEGEVWVRGPQVMKGYLRNPEATAATVDAESWLRTGDIGRADADGNLILVDRLKELIKVQGYQVAPAELEAVLLRHPAVADAAVVPIPDDEAGERPKGFVVLRDVVAEEDLVAFVAEHVAPYKRIRSLEVIDAIPKSPSGKILRRLLVNRDR